MTNKLRYSPRFAFVVIQARLAKNKKKLASICHAITDPPVTKIRLPWYGLLLGCQSGLDGGHNFFLFPPQKTLKSSSDGRAHHRNRSGVVGLVGREPLIIARVENGVTKFSPQRQKTPNFSKKNWVMLQCQWGNFHFFGRGKTNFGGGITSKFAS